MPAFDQALVIVHLEDIQSILSEQTAGHGTRFLDSGSGFSADQEREDIIHQAVRLKGAAIIYSEVENAFLPLQVRFVRFADSRSCLVNNPPGNPRYG